jgi:hypothetical protein
MASAGTSAIAYCFSPRANSFPDIFALTPVPAGILSSLGVDGKVVPPAHRADVLILVFGRAEAIAKVSDIE